MSANRHSSSLDGLNGLKVVVREQGTTTTIELHGECDLAGLPSMRHALSSVVEGRPEYVVLDLSRLDYIDSSGLRATVELTRRSDAQSTRVVIIPGPRPVQWVFEVSGLLEKLPFIDERLKASSHGSPNSTRIGAARSGAFSSASMSTHPRQPARDVARVDPARTAEPHRHAAPSRPTAGGRS